MTKKIILALVTLSMTPSLAHAAPIARGGDHFTTALCPVWNGTVWVWKPCSLPKR